MFGSDQPTPFDVRFRLGGIPVRVSPWFWIIMALLGSSVFHDDGPEYLLIWMFCGFVSILVHEMGHGVAARLFGSPVRVTLLAFGGVAETLYPPRTPFKRLLISFAGPAAGFGLLGMVIAVIVGTESVSLESHLEAALQYLFVMNLFWNLFNLLPIWPLDGGKIGRELFAMARLRNPDATINITSMIFAGTLAAIGILAFVKVTIPGIEGKIPKLIFSYLSHSPMLTLWMVLFAFTNYQMWQMNQRRGFYSEDDDSPPWRRN